MIDRRKRKWLGKKTTWGKRNALLAPTTTGPSPKNIISQTSPTQHTDGLYFINPPNVRKQSIPTSHQRSKRSIQGLFERNIIEDTDDYLPDYVMDADIVGDVSKRLWNPFGNRKRNKWESIDPKRGWSRLTSSWGKRDADDDVMQHFPYADKRMLSLRTDVYSRYPAYPWHQSKVWG